MCVHALAMAILERKQRLDTIDLTVAILLLFSVAFCPVARIKEEEEEERLCKAERERESERVQHQAKGGRLIVCEWRSFEADCVCAESRVKKKKGLCVISVHIPLSVSLSWRESAKGSHGFHWRLYLQRGSTAREQLLPLSLILVCRVSADASPHLSVRI